MSRKPSPVLTSSRFLLRSAAHHRRLHFAVALGVAAATAVLTGALIVGDSVRGSLARLVLDRLGRIDDQLVADRFFRVALKEELATRPEFARDYERAAAALLIPGGTVERSGGGDSSGDGESGARRAGGVLVLGVEPDFWEFGSDGPRPRVSPGDDEIVLNEPLAADLGAKVGDTVLLRLPKSNDVPADSPLGRKTDRIRTLADLKVVDIIPASGLGRYSLRSSQHFPRNAFVSLEVMQRAIGRPARANALFLAAKNPLAARDPQALLAPQLTDFGLAVRRVRQTFKPPQGGAEQVIHDYFQLSSDRLMLEPAVEQAALRAFKDEQPQSVLTYLATSMLLAEDAPAEKVPSEKTPSETTPDAKATSADPIGAQPTSARTRSSQSPNSQPTVIPYSMISAVDSRAGFGPLVDDTGAPLGPLADDEIVLNSWAAADLGAEVGQKVKVVWFAPETTHATVLEESAEFRVRAIVRVTEPIDGFHGDRPPTFDERPTLANDPHLTPTVEGVTDQDTISNWDPPFPYDQKRVRPRDDDYWSNHRTTPKAFVSLAAGRARWGSRFGQTTSIRVPAREGLDEAELERRLIATLAADGQRLGLEFIPVKQRSLAAARGTTPFDALFLSLSFFIIAAALILVLLLYRLGVEQRASEIGVLLATGWTTRRVARVLAAEGALVASIGGVVGVALGLGYAWLMLTGLRTWWLGAVAVPFLELHVSLTSLIVGAASGVLVSTGVIALSLRQLARVPIRPLLGGRFETMEAVEAVGKVGMSHGARPAQGLWRRVQAKLSPAGIAIGCIVGAVIALAVGPSLSGEAQAGAFVGAGAMLLTAMLAYCWRVLTTSAKQGPTHVSPPKLGLARLAWRNASRNPGRTVMTIGLLASACFLIISMSAFRLAPSSAGTGGFALIGESSQPLLADLNADETRAEWDAKARRLLEGTRIYGLRLKPGDDASCSNLYQATQPRVLGVPRDFVERFSASGVGGFSWAGVAAKSDADRANPWRLLDSANAEGPVPVVLDKNTALYSLHLYGGVGQEFEIEYEGGLKVRFRVVGLLGGSVLQGSLLISEAEFKRLFPDISGHRAFLVATSADGAAASKIGQTLEELFGDQGLDLTSTERLLSDYLAVQNTYLSTFQSLGALGLLLGTFGLAAAQLRSVLERRGELALMRATGFRRGRLAQLVLLEHGLLLSLGLGIGLAAALGAIGPLMAGGGMQGARASLGELATWVGLIFVVGLAAGGGAVRATMRAPVIGALRGD